MPFRSGSLSVRRYRLISEVPATLAATATVAMRRYAWRPIDDSRGEKESFGWVNPREILVPQLVYEEVVDGSHMLLGVRRDKKAFSKVLFKARLELLMDKVRREKKIQRLSRQQRIALEEQLTVEMLTETSPQSAFAELVWEMDANVVLMGATSGALCERIQELFEATFDLKLRPAFPAISGGEFIAAQGLEQEYHLAEA